MNIIAVQYQLASHFSDIITIGNSGAIPHSEAIVFERLMGLKTIPRDPNENIISLVIKTLDRLFLQYPVNKEKIKYFLFSHTAEFVAPFGFCYLNSIAKHFHFRLAKFFSVNTHKCAGPFQLISLSQKIFPGLENDDFILIASADIVFTKILEYIPGSTVMGESGVSILLQKNGDSHRYIDSLSFFNGKYAKGVWGDHSEFLDFQSEYIIYLRRLILGILEKNQLKLSKIKLILPHNVNMLSWKQVSQSLSIPLQKIYLKNIQKIGHCFGSDPWINLSDAMTEKMITPGDYYLLITVGLGATFSALLFQC